MTELSRETIQRHLSSLKEERVQVLRLAALDEDLQDKSSSVEAQSYPRAYQGNSDTPEGGHLDLS